MFWQRTTAVLMAVIVALAAVAVIAVSERQLDRYEQRAQRAEIHADSLMALAAELESEAAYHEARADSIERDATERVRQVRERVVALRAVVTPDTCAPFVAPRDSAIDDALAAADTLGLALDEARLALRAKDSMIGVLRLSHDSLLAVVRERPKPRPKWKPSLGVTVGACSTGEAPCAAVGLTWSF